MNLAHIDYYRTFGGKLRPLQERHVRKIIDEEEEKYGQSIVNPNKKNPCNFRSIRV